MENDNIPVLFMLNIVIRYTIMGAVGIINYKKTIFFFYFQNDCNTKCH